MAMAVPHYHQHRVGGGQPGAHPATVRVECTAADCGALLEVNVPHEQASQNPLVVRCGNCKKLLQVELVEKQPSPKESGAHYGALHMHTSSPQPPPTPPSAHPHVFGHGGARNGLQAPQLSMPAPLSRSLFRTSSSPRSSAPKYSHPTAGHYPAPSDPYYQHYPPSFGPPQHPSTLAYHGTDARGSHGHLQLHMGSQASHPPPHSSRLWNRGAGYEEDHGGLTGLTSPFSTHARGPGGRSFEEPSRMPLGDATADKKKKRKRTPSPYNMFMREEVKRLKEVDPGLDHREAFKMAASNWAKSPDKCRGAAYGSYMQAMAKLPNPSGKPPTACVASASRNIPLAGGLLARATTPQGQAPHPAGLKQDNAMGVEPRGMAPSSSPHVFGTESGVCSMAPDGGANVAPSVPGMQWPVSGAVGENCGAIGLVGPQGSQSDDALECAVPSAHLSAALEVGLCTGFPACGAMPEDGLCSRGQTAADGGYQSEGLGITRDTEGKDPGMCRCVIVPADGGGVSVTLVPNTDVEAAWRR